MSRLKKPILCICEGASEKAYLQELNRYFDEEEIPLYCIPKPSNGGQYIRVRNTYRAVRKANPKSTILIWVDWDRYKRNDEKDMDNYQKKPSDIPNFLFSVMNFEDFLSMHLEREDLNRWWISCTSRNHFNSPSHSREYLHEFECLLGIHYVKGEVPICITMRSLENLRMHQEESSIPFKCDFAEELFRLIKTVL
jgi:hypothetical protein